MSKTLLILMFLCLGFILILSIFKYGWLFAIVMGIVTVVGFLTITPYESDGPHDTGPM